MSDLTRARLARDARAESATRKRRRPIVIGLDDLHARAGFATSWRREPACVLLVAIVCLALLNFLSTTPVLAWLLAVDEAALPAEWTSAYWVGCRVLCYFLLPAVTVAALGHQPVESGLRLRGVVSQLPLYLALAMLMLPIVIVVSFVPAFQRYYPFYDYAGSSLRGLLWWEGLYALQFVTLEYFYRGFLLFSLERYFGVYAVFVMIIPYTMMHFGKPFAETLAAIPAGIVLGVLALKTRSIWPGAALHIAVGLSMDMLSLWHRGLLVELWNGA